MTDSNDNNSNSGSPQRKKGKKETISKSPRASINDTESEAEESGNKKPHKPGRPNKSPEKIKDTPQAKRNAEKYSVELTVNAEEDNFCNSPVVNKNRNINASPEKAASKKSKRKITEVNECISDSDSDSSGDTSSGSDSDDSSMSKSSSDEDDSKYRKRLDNTDEHGAVIRDWNEFVDKNEKWLRR